MTTRLNHSLPTTQPIRRTALITGASRGLGQVLAAFLAGQGFHLLITARDPAALDAAATDLTAAAGQVIALAGDVADPAHRRRLVQAAGNWGRLDLLINNASTLGLSPLRPLVEYPVEAFENVLETNLLTPVALVQAALPLLSRSRSLVVNISSDAALGGYPGWGAYGASKAALDLVSLTLANELREQGIGVVSVDPGDMRTQMHQEAFPGEDIGDRPLPEITLPFWAWLLAQDPLLITSQRFTAQGEVWLETAPGK